MTQYYYAPPPAPEPWHKRWRGALVVGGAFVVLGLFGSCTGTALHNTAETTSAAPTTSYQYAGPLTSVAAAPAVQAPVAPPAPVESGPLAWAGDGIHLVGEDIVPGRYKTTGPDPSDFYPNCYFARLSNDSGDFRAIIANENIQGRGSVTVKSGEFLELSGGCTWTKAG